MASKKLDENIKEAIELVLEDMRNVRGHQQWSKTNLYKMPRTTIEDL